MRWQPTGYCSSWKRLRRCGRTRRRSIQSSSPVSGTGLDLGGFQAGCSALRTSASRVASQRGGGGGGGGGLHRSNILRRRDCRGALGRRLRPEVGAAGASRRRRPAALQGCAKRELPGKRCAPKSRLRGGVWLAPGHLSQRALLTGPQLARKEHEDLRLDSFQHHLRKAPSEEEAGPPAQQPRGACPNAKRQRKTIMKNERRAAAQGGLPAP
ncbi:uncharacterized protein LOC124594308 [Schistocerca americana]|uniref:uncharacterized protein LOC124594308 n=1 Tax=Schistocerca americana TaxID=7009 RepID=UPI001F4FAAC6|nr:uncharacterized protein LOC124594308 [Schistocerca americana]